MALEGNIEAMYPTRKGPGVLIKGCNHTSDWDVFDEIMGMLYDFYEGMEIAGNEDGVIMPTVPFDRGAEEYKLPVYFADVCPVNYRYFDRRTGRHLGFNFDIGDVFGLAWDGHDIDRVEGSSRPARKYGNVWVKKLSHDEGRRFEGIHLGEFKWDKPVFLVYLRAYDKDRAKADEISIEDRNSFAAMAGTP